MNPILKNAILCGLLFLICCCLFRQRRYWRELRTNRPSGSVRAGYTLAVLSVAITLIIAAFVNTTSMWQVFGAVLIMGLVFCVKVTFSPSVLACVLGICTYQFYVLNEFPLWTVWSGLLSVLSWRLPEEVRVLYASLSFLWVLFSVLLPSKAVESASTSEQIGDVVDSLSSFHA